MVKQEQGSLNFETIWFNTLISTRICQIFFFWNFFFQFKWFWSFLEFSLFCFIHFCTLSTFCHSTTISCLACAKYMMKTRKREREKKHHSKFKWFIITEWITFYKIEYVREFVPFSFQKLKKKTLFFPIKNEFLDVKLF